MIFIQGNEGISIRQVQPDEGLAFRDIRLTAITERPTALSSSPCA